MRQNKVHISHHMPGIQFWCNGYDPVYHIVAVDILRNFHVIYFGCVLWMSATFSNLKLIQILLCNLVERSALFLLTGDEFNCNTKSKLVRKAQTISLFIGKYMGLIRFAANTFMTIKNELCRLAATNEHVEELNDLKRRLFGYYSREFSTFVPAIIAIIILTLCMCSNYLLFLFMNWIFTDENLSFLQFTIHVWRCKSIRADLRKITYMSLKWHWIDWQKTTKRTMTTE